MTSWLARLLDTCRRSRLDRELEREIAVHLDLAASDLEADGLSPAEARRAARRTFGGVSQTTEADREVRGFPVLEQAFADARSAVRALRRTPSSTAVMVLTLAIGIGVTTAIFSVVYGALLKPLPFQAPDRLVAVNHQLPGFGFPRNGPQSAATYFTYRDHTRVFEDIGLWSPGEVSVRTGDTPERVRVLRVSDGLFPLLRVRPLLGRLIEREDDVPGAPNRAVLTYRYWESAFGAARDILGWSLTIDGAPYTVVGVLPASFIFLNTDPQIVLPLKLDRAQAYPGAGFGPRGIARLKPGVTLAQATDDIARTIPLIVEQFPLQPGVTREMWASVGLGPDLRVLAEEVVGEARRFLWVLLASASIVLLIACVNVASLLLVRGEGRQQEFAVRGALGASRVRMARALVAESLVLSLVGGCVGVLGARAGVGLLRRVAPAELPRVSEVAIDGTVLAFTLVLSIVSALMFALLPAVRFTRLNLHTLRDGGRSSSTAPGRHRTRNMLVVTQIGLALLLLIVAGLMMRTFNAMRQVPPGFVRPAEVQTFRIAVPAALVRESEQLVRTYEQIAERLSHIPGVTHVGATSRVTMDRPPAGGGPFFVKDRPTTGPPTLRRVLTITPGYLEAMGNAVLAGRTITPRDVAARARVALVSANLAREWFDTPERALGQRIGGGDGEWFEIVGVVGDSRDDGVNRPPPTLIYMSMGGFEPSRTMSYVVRSARVGAPGFLNELKHAVQVVNPDLPLGNVRTLDGIQAVSMAQTSFAVYLFGLAAGVALLLALVGIYGVVAYVAAERTHEVGIRMALGADAGGVRRLFLRHGVRLAITGIAFGLVAAAILTPLMAAMLYGVRALDPLTYLGVSSVVMAVTVLATYLPAHRAARVAPLQALRAGP